MNKENRDYREREKEAIEKFEGSIEKTKNDIDEAKMVRNKQVEDILIKITERLGNIQVNIFEERKGREESYDQLIKNLGSEIMRVNRMVHTEKKQREENQDELLGLVNALYEKFTREIEVS